MDKETRNSIERATQRARNLLEDDFVSQLEGVFDVQRNGAVAPKAGSHLAPRQVFQRDKIVAERKGRLRAIGVEAAVLERDDKVAIRYRALTEAEIRSALGD